MDYAILTLKTAKNVLKTAALVPSVEMVIATPMRIVNRAPEIAASANLHVVNPHRHQVAPKIPLSKPAYAPKTSSVASSAGIICA